LSWPNSRYRVPAVRPCGCSRLQRLPFHHLGRLWLPSSPFDLSVSLGPCRSSAVKPDTANRSTVPPPLVPFTPLRRLDLNFAAHDPLPPKALTLRRKSMNTSPKLHGPSAYPDWNALLVHRTFRSGVSKTLPCSGEVPPPGFGYPLGGFLALPALESLFQDPTLLGFTLQSLAPSP
jgi:hypothetical protein